MATNLIRSSVRVIFNAARFSPQLRSVANKAFLTNHLFAATQQKQQQTKISALKCFSSEAKYNKEQVEKKVLDILTNFDRIKENPAKPTVTLESHISKDLGLDSLDHVEIIVQLEDAFGYEIPDSDYEKLYTPNEIVKYIQKRLAEI